MDDPPCVRDFTHEGLVVRIYLTAVQPDFFGGHVDVFEGDALKCRIALAGPLDHDAAIDALEVKGRDWIAARGLEPPGAADFGQR